MLTLRNSKGSAPIETVFALVFLLTLGLGVMQVALTLYGRNVLISATHEAARAAVELARSDEEVVLVAERHARDAAGGLVEMMDVDTEVMSESGRTAVAVSVRATIRSMGPVPLTVPVSARALSEVDEVTFIEK